MFPTFLFYSVSKKRVIQERLERSIHNSNITVNDNFKAEKSKDFKHSSDREDSKSSVLEGCRLTISYTFSMKAVSMEEHKRFAFSSLCVRYIRTFETQRNREYAIINYARNQIAAATSLPYRQDTTVVRTMVTMRGLAPISRPRIIYFHREKNFAIRFFFNLYFP